MLNDTQVHARLMRDALQSKGYNLRYVESSEGHSYGNWRGKLDQLLVFFFGGGSQRVTHGVGVNCQ